MHPGAETLLANEGIEKERVAAANKYKDFTKPILIMKNTIHINFAIFLIIANIIYSSASASTDISTVASQLFEGTEGCFLLYDASTNAEIAQFNKAKCAVNGTRFNFQDRIITYGI